MRPTVRFTPPDLPRRCFLAAVPLGLGAAALGQPASATESTLWPTFPHQRPDLVRETVGASHFDEKRVRELVTAHPALANATWDWGFGDWETALGAASHTGRRAIAEFLISKGARIDIFAAAMLGHLDTVKALIAASPGIQRTLGPHCIPLLAHAKAGGDAAKPVFEYLQQLGDAGDTPDSVKLPEDQHAIYTGEYQFGASDSDRLTIVQEKGSLWIARGKEAKRGLTFVGNHAFFPAGAPAVRIAFEVSGLAATSLTVIDGESLVIAQRR